MTVAFKTHTCCQPAHTPRTHTLSGMYKYEASGKSHGIERAVDESSVHVCENKNVCVKICLIFVAVFAPYGVKQSLSIELLPG